MRFPDWFIIILLVLICAIPAIGQFWWFTSSSSLGASGAAPEPPQIQIEEWEYLGIMEITAYHYTGRLSYSGVPAEDWFTAAKHPRVTKIKYGDIIRIDDWGEWHITDKIPDYQKADLDLMMPEAKKFGRKKLRVWRRK